MNLHIFASNSSESWKCYEESLTKDIQVHLMEMCFIYITWNTNTDIKCHTKVVYPKA